MSTQHSPLTSGAGASEELHRSLYRPVVFQTPNRTVDPASWLEHIPFAFWIMDVLRPAAFVELGTHSGNSYAAFAQAAQVLGLNTAAYAVDTWRGDPQAGFYGEDVFEEWSRYHDRHFAAFSRLIRATFDEAATHFADGSVDLLHIDGWHTYEAVSADYAQWRAKMSQRGVVILHDINVRERDFGAWRFWQEISVQSPSFAFLHGHGLGVVGVGTDLPPALQWLLSRSGGPDESEVRQFFAQLGGAISTRFALGQLEERLRALKLQATPERPAGTPLQTLDAMLAEHALVVTQLSAEAEVQRAEANLQRAEANVQRAEASAQRAEVSAQRAEVSAQRATVAEQAQRVAELERDLRAAEQRHAEVLELRASAASELATQMATELAAATERSRRIAAERNELLAARTVMMKSSSTPAAEAAPAAPRARAVRGLRRLSRFPAALGLVPGSGRPLSWTSLRLLVRPRQMRDAWTAFASGLFDEGYYREANRDVAASRMAPLTHFVTKGVHEDRNPHPLFDVAFYLRHNPDVASARLNPLTHYCTGGAYESRSPHPLFDVPYYLHQNPDIRASHIEPLGHFLRSGAYEGRNPNPSFDCAYYLAQAPDVVAIHLNPLVHYVLYGRDERRATTEPPAGHVEAEPPPLELLPSVEMKATALAGSRRDAPAVLCLTHVLPLRPRAGNEYRIHRMLRWFLAQGYRVIPVVAPLPGDPIDRDAVHALAAEFGNAVLCDRDGRIDYVLRDVPDVLATLAGETTRPFGVILDDAAIEDDHGRRLLQMDRTFCHDVLISAVLRLHQALGPYVLLNEYIWMSRILPLLGGQVVKVIDTIDVFSAKRDKVLEFGIDDLHVEPHEEARRLALADLIVAIQDDERRELERLVPGKRVVTAGVDFEIAADAGRPSGRRVLLVGSDNPMNKKGLADFLRFAWPSIRREVPDAELLVAGRVGSTMNVDVPGVTRLGMVDDLEPLYDQARIVINPAVAGTGLKIKTLEALGHLRTVVTWPSGTDGLAPELAALCVIVRDWYEFSQQVTRLLNADEPPVLSSAQRETLARRTSPVAAYGAMTEAIEALRT